MKIFNLGLAEIIFIIIIALILFGPDNMVKTAREAGAFIRRVTKSPYWKEVWATKREIDEIPKMLREEVKLDETLKDLDRETKSVSSTIASSVSDLIKEVNEPLKDLDKELKAEDKAIAAAVTTAKAEAAAPLPSAIPPAPVPAPVPDPADQSPATNNTQS
ncbi:MAG TPA: twin-arginine translocase TatA/TatE family subunit [Anaerolineaceae bacterium]|nr:twin-arginine translocase TatA/TatE family subunit [Anaerolineaceae bacterium]